VLDLEGHQHFVELRVRVFPGKKKVSCDLHGDVLTSRAPPLRHWQWQRGRSHIIDTAMLEEAVIFRRQDGLHQFFWALPHI